MYLSKRIRKKIIVSAYLCRLFGVIGQEDYHSMVNQSKSNH